MEEEEFHCKCCPYGNWSARENLVKQLDSILTGPPSSNLRSSTSIKRIPRADLYPTPPLRQDIFIGKRVFILGSFPIQGSGRKYNMKEGVRDAGGIVRSTPIGCDIIMLGDNIKSKYLETAQSPEYRKKHIQSLFQNPMEVFDKAYDGNTGRARA